MSDTQTIEPLAIAGHTFRQFEGVDAAFGARLRDYPKMEALPEEYRRGHADGCRIFSKLFFGGGRLSDHGRSLKAGVDSGRFYTALRALMSSFDPPHELKTATCGLLIDTYTEAADQ